MLAKRPVQSPEIGCLNQCLREPAHSHRDLYPFCLSSLSRFSGLFQTYV
ncbi:hypothetical protein KPSA3_05746 [Pseudomonas syringae pv. actinidiae]|uniref:Uncharacterized protein n=1 Tax=Pseudomonas syringae pv. actinidiae TaxID=103796 RepID=A0AAN4Q9C1_PSESF|nr:hypothetical protein KPSA3_05746 [Pseudomonas syringae pv. actinidiae]